LPTNARYRVANGVSFNNTCMFPGQGVVIRASQIQRSTGNSTSMWETQCQVLWCLKWLNG